MCRGGGRQGRRYSRPGSSLDALGDGLCCGLALRRMERSYHRYRPPSLNGGNQARAKLRASHAAPPAASHITAFICLQSLPGRMIYVLVGREKRAGPMMKFSSDDFHLMIATSHSFNITYILERTRPISNHVRSRLDQAPAHGRVYRHFHLCVGRLRYVRDSLCP